MMGSMCEKGSPTTVVGLSEERILKVINSQISRLDPAWPAGSIGPGDDAAVVAAPDQRVVISTDAMSQNRDFRTVWPAGVVDNGYSTGWKAAAQNLSDMNAMGARATALVIALTMPSKTPISWVRSFTAGIVGSIQHLHAHGCLIAGGDLGSGDTLSVAVTVTGNLEGRVPVTRRLSGGEQPPSLDLIHSGPIGWAAAGLAVLETPRVELESLLSDRSDAGSLIRSMATAIRGQMRPRPPLSLGPTSAESVLCMMDVSDGLERDAWRLADANQMVPELDQEWLKGMADCLEPLAQLLGADATTWVRTGGEDYGLLAAIPRDVPPPPGWSRCGVLRPRDGDTVGEDVSNNSGGWDHFSR